MAPSTPSGTSEAMARRSARLDTPPLATTGAVVRAQTARSRSRLGPRSVPSLSTSVTTYRAQPSASSRSSVWYRSPPSAGQRVVVPDAARHLHLHVDLVHHVGEQVRVRAAPERGVQVHQVDPRGAGPLPGQRGLHRVAVL